MPHFVLPKFSKVELCKLFNVRRVTSFALRLDGVPGSVGESIESELSKFNQLLEAGSADIKKYRYADDSMFEQRSR
jgi:hypothetical protein